MIQMRMIPDEKQVKVSHVCSNHDSLFLILIQSRLGILFKALTRVFYSGILPESLQILHIFLQLKLHMCLIINENNTFRDRIRPFKAHLIYAFKSHIIMLVSSLHPISRFYDQYDNLH
jgi:hypothetical protein